MMNNEKRFNGCRLKAARMYRGMTIAELADKLELQRQTISMYESNQIKQPDYPVLSRMAQILDFPHDYFLETDKVSIQTGSTYFRALLTTNKKYRNEQIQKMEFLSIIYQFISEYVTFPSTQIPQIIDGVSPEMAALALRDHWGLGEKPIDNIIYHAEQHGILVTSFETSSDDVDAFSQLHSFEASSRFLIAYSKNKTSAARVHFDIAHELGHILLHEWSEDVEALSREDFREREYQAHDFASCFLLPRKPFERDLGAYATKLPYYSELKKKWKVSIAAMIRRAYTLEKIDLVTYQRLMRTMQKSGIRKEEPLDDILFTAKPALLKTAVRMLLEGNNPVFTAQDFLAELSRATGLSMHGREVEYLLDLPQGTLAISNNMLPFPELRLRK